jgi:adenosylcobinamide-phosphate synthase
VIDGWPEALLALAIAFALDALAGEYPALLHPVVWMGHAIGLLERRAPAGPPRAQLLYGAGMAVGLPALFAAGAWALAAAARPWPLAHLAVVALLLKPTFAVRALGLAADEVRDALAAGDLASARYRLRSLCSRDASRLTGPQISAAAVESVAENLSDSFVAPVLWYVVAGLPGAVAYRALNTLDARIGYHGKYEWLGKASARLDDLANLVPSRLTAALLLCSGLVSGADVLRGWRVLRRDGGKTESPNAGQPMSAMAGLLGVALEKVDHYRLGDAVEEVGPHTIDRAWRVAGLGVLFALGLALLALEVVRG